MKKDVFCIFYGNNIFYGSQWIRKDTLMIDLTYAEDLAYRNGN
jgi:hypothetical protein